MHAFMAAVLLRLARLDAFDGDAEAQPPYGKLAQTEKGMGTGKRDAVIGTDGGREPKLLKYALKNGEDMKLLG